MRAREMHNKLDRLSAPSEDDEQTAPDISLLSPEDQDRVYDLLAKLDGATGEQEIRAKIEKNVVTVAELYEVFDLWADLPRLGPGDSFRGPSYTIPHQLCSHFTHFLRRENEGAHSQFDFSKLKLVQKARFVELCQKYGWEGEYPNPERGHGWKYLGPVNMVPLCEWDPDDEAELRSFLDAAEKVGQFERGRDGDLG